MQWMRFRHEGRARFGVLDGDAVVVHDGDMYGDCSPTGERIAQSQIEWLPACQPSKMLALWNNFHAAAAKNGWSTPSEPLYFVKTPNTVAAHDMDIRRPRSYTGRVLFEGELAVVIGRRAIDVSVEQAADHVFGYTCANDVTALEVLRADPSFEQWTRAKSFDGFAPIGPVIASGVDPAGLTVVTRMNGRERQRYPVADMIFSPLQLVSLLSRDMTLEPGDVILCGTSLGAAPMPPGAVVEVEIDGIGTLRNRMGPA